MLKNEYPIGLPLETSWDSIGVELVAVAHTHDIFPQVTGDNITKWKRSLEAHSWFKGIASSDFIMS